MKRILVIRGGAIGDFVLTLPTLKALRDNLPAAQIEVLGYKHIVALADRRYYADATRSIEYGPLSSFFSRDAELPSELVECFGRFDCVISYLFDPDQVFEGNLRRSGVRRLVVGPAKLSGDSHAAVQLSAPLRELDMSLQTPAAQIFPSQEDRDFAEQFLATVTGPLLAIHPGSGGVHKTWPVERWRDLATSMSSGDSAPTALLVTGEADVEIANELEKFWPNESLISAHTLPLPQLAAVLERCVQFIGHDSGISHIAAAVGTPCLLLFGPTDPNVWAPQNENVRVIRSPTGQMKDLELSAVVTAVDELSWPSLTN
jgi:heptosyltransferase-2